MESKKIKTMNCVYYAEDDILGFHSSDKERYEVSEFLTTHVVMDLNPEGQPIGVEILDASEILKTSKNALKNISKGNIHIEIQKELISLAIELKINKNITSGDNNINKNVYGNNEIELPLSNTEASLIAI